MRWVRDRLYVFALSFIFMGAIFALGAQAQLPSYVPGAMIIKFKDSSSLGTIAQELFEKNQSFESVTKNFYLDELNHKYGVIKISKLHRDPRSLETIKAKFPERTKRIPPGVNTPGTDSIYRVEFRDKETDILSICEKYAQDPNVEYAQPDYIVTIQANEGDTQ